MFINKKKIIFCLILILIPLFLFSGCLNSNDRDGADDSNGEVIDDSRETVILYFGDTGLMASGLQGEYGFLKPVEREVSVSDDFPRQALEQLMSGPLTEEEEASRTIPETAELADFKIEDNIAFVDFKDNFFDNYAGGTLAGSVFIDSLIYTLTEFPTVEKVMVTVGGEPWCDGHFIWEEPMGR